MEKDTSQPSSDDEREIEDMISEEEKNLSEKTHAQLKHEAKLRLQHLDSKTAADVINEVFGKPVGSSVRGFVQFLREHAVIGLAVAFVFATQVQVIVKQLIASFLDPFLQLLTGNKSLNERVITLHLNGHSAVFTWGAFVYAFIDFVFIIAAIYAIIKIFNLDKLDRQKTK
jgi:large-conductance mechanosensitive channel